MILFSKKKLKVYFIIILTGVFLAILCKLFIFEFLTISGQSMTPNIKNNQKIIINKIAYGIQKPLKGEFLFQWSSPKKNDVVIFLHNNKIVVKRCILIQGESLEFLYDEQYNYYYIQTGERKIEITREQKKRFENCTKVPEGYVFVVGDNDKYSIDSRDYGFVSVKNITGRVIGK